VSAAAPALESIRGTPNALAPHYSRFDVASRLLFTGHSHQAWPDATREAQLEAWDDAAGHADEKWERAFAKADRVRTGFARLLGCAADEVALGTSTHELVVRFLSALPLGKRPRLLTTDGEFHIYTVRPDGSDLTAIVDTPGVDEKNPAWGPPL